MLEHISEWLSALCVNLVEFANEAKGGLEVVLERHHLGLVLKAHHGQLGTESHVVERLLVSQSQLGSVRVELIQREARHHTDVVRLFLPARKGAHRHHAEARGTTQHHGWLLLEQHVRKATKHFNSIIASLHLPTYYQNITH